MTVEEHSAVDNVLLTAASFVDRVAKNALRTTAQSWRSDPDCNGATAGAASRSRSTVRRPPGHRDLHLQHCGDGNGGDKINDRVTVTGKDDANRTSRTTGRRQSTSTTSTPAIDVQKTVRSTGPFGDGIVAGAGRHFTYKVVVTNTSDGLV